MKSPSNGNCSKFEQDLVYRKKSFQIQTNGSTTSKIVFCSPPLSVVKYVKQALLSYYCIATPVGLTAIHQSLISRILTILPKYKHSIVKKWHRSSYKSTKRCLVQL